MTQQEHLNRIRARCVELLSIWDNKRDHNPLYNATCGKEAESGWKATIEMIDLLPAMDWHTAERATDYIIASWPAELL